MPQQPDYRRRRIMLATATAVLVVGASHRAPMIGTVSVSVDEQMIPQVDADWTPPVALAIAGAGRIMALVAANRTR